MAALQELDFELEAANSKRCQSHLNSKKSRVKGKVVVPQVEDGMFNKRVLVMEYIEGFKVTDRSDMHCNDTAQTWHVHWQYGACNDCWSTCVLKSSSVEMGSQTLVCVCACPVLGTQVCRRSQGLQGAHKDSFLRSIVF